MKKLYLFVVASITVVLQVLFFSNPGTASAGVVTIAEDGQAIAEIVVPANPPYIVKLAAEELKHYLDKITGGYFKITSRPEGQIVIRLGESAEAEAAGLDPSELKRDGFYISAGSNSIFIVGADNPSTSHKTYNNIYHEPKRATLYGVYEFLEQLGVRWPAPGPDHEVVPSSPTIEITEGRQKIEPFFLDRTLFLYGFPEYADSEKYGSEEDVYLWGLRIKACGRYILWPHAGHSERPLLGSGEPGDIKDLWAREHPERLALNPYRDEAHFDGERSRHFSCWTDPGVLEIWKRMADGYFSGETPRQAGASPYLGERWPWTFRAEDEFMIDPMDHWGHFDGRCRCDRCNEFRESYPSEDDTEILWRVIAKVAEYIREKHPGKYITTLVYPPKGGIPEYTEVPDNVRVRICTRGPVEVTTPDQLEPKLNLIRSWSETLDGYKPPLWTYQVHSHFGRAVPGVPETYPRLIAEFLRITRDDIAGMFFEQHHPTQTIRNLDAYITARFLWNPDRDIEEELAEYFRAYYGPAAEPAQKLFDRFEANWIDYWELIQREGLLEIGLGRPREDLQKLVWTEIYDREEMDAIEGIIADIEEAAEGDPVYSERVGLLRTYIFDAMNRERRSITLLMEVDEMVELDDPWYEWKFRKDPREAGVAEGWHGEEYEEEKWKPIRVPAFLSDTWAGRYHGYGWYRTRFTVPEEKADRDMRLLFEGVDEQAWVYVNGEYVGEHTETSEQRSPGVLWDKPFTIRVEAGILKPGEENVLVVRTHASAFEAGIWEPVSAYFPEN